MKLLSYGGKRKILAADTKWAIVQLYEKKKNTLEYVCCFMSN